MVDNVSLNYRKKNELEVGIIEYILGKNVKILLSLENKKIQKRP